MPGAIAGVDLMIDEVKKSDIVVKELVSDFLKNNPTKIDHLLRQHIYSIHQTKRD